METKMLFAFVTTFFFSLPCFSQMKGGDNVVIREKVDHDLYVAGGTVTIDAPVYGDLIVAGGTITVNDTITQDILIAGGNILLNGYVGDDIRCAGGTVNLSNNIIGDVVATGGRIYIDKEVVINGNLLISGGQATVDGEVKGSINSASGTLTLNGKAGNDIECRGGSITINGIVNGNSIIAANTINLGPDAVFNKDVKYWNKKHSLDFGKTLHGGAAIFDPSLELENGKWYYLGFASFLMVLWYLGTAFVLILLIQYLFSTTLKIAANTVKSTSLKSLGLGLIFMVGVPIAVVVSFITIVGLPIGILMLIGYVTLVLLATIIVALLAANWINNTYYQSTWGTGRLVLAAFVIFIFLKLFSLTPFIGPLIMLLLACIAFGGILQNIKWKSNKTLALT